MASDGGKPSDIIYSRARLIYACTVPGQAIIHRVTTANENGTEQAELVDHNP